MQQLDFYDLLSGLQLSDVYAAYYSCRKNKRCTQSSLRYEMAHEQNLYTLWRNIQSRRYEICTSNAFVVQHPVLREVFAADFQDRIVHHLAVEKLIHIFEDVFSDFSFSCRVGKGTLFGVRQVTRMLSCCSQNGTRDCYVLRLDIQGFFFHINKKILYQKLKHLVIQRYHQPDKSDILYLLRMTLFDDPTKHCMMNSHKELWQRLSKSKSLFHSAPYCGLPIGNLTSQIFANFYLNDLDHYITAQDSNLHYGRYVDDLVLIHPDKDFLKQMQYRIQTYLQHNLHLSLHPQKCVLRHYGKGFNFTGSYIHQGRVYISNRTKKSFYKRIEKLNREWDALPNRWIDIPLIQKTLCSINSYLGLMRHMNTWRLRLKGWNMLHERIRETYSIDRDLLKLTIRPHIQKRIDKIIRKRLLPPL